LIDRLADEVRQAQPANARVEGSAARGQLPKRDQPDEELALNRVEFIDKQLVQPPVLSAAGGTVMPGSHA
jgi:hypothetical protein